MWLSSSFLKTSLGFSGPKVIPVTGYVSFARIAVGQGCRVGGGGARVIHTEDTPLNPDTWINNI